MIIGLFRTAGATGHVFYLKNGRVYDKGLAFSSLIGPQTTVAVVPTTPQILNFAVEARTKDKQDVMVAGDIKVTLDPSRAVNKFDFTVDPKSGAYKTAWEQVLRSVVVEQVLAPIHDKARQLDVETATQSHKDFELAVKNLLAQANNPLAAQGVKVESCSIARVDATDEEVNEAIGSKERQSMLTESDRAIHVRRLNAAENERAVRTYESQTALKLEEERTLLLNKQGENKLAEAEADAAATKKRLEPYKDIEPGRVLGASLMKMGESGRIGQLSIVPEMLAAMDRK